MSVDELDDDQDEKIEADPTEILDPADYNQNQRLKEIHQARKEVRKALEETTTGRATDNEHVTTHNRLAQTVAFYGHELLPLMDKAEWSHEFKDGHTVTSVREFITRLGRYPGADWPYTPKPVSMEIFARLNEFAAEVGLGAQLDEGTDEWEI
jgi:hypothetical protein